MNIVSMMLLDNGFAALWLESVVGGNQGADSQMVAAMENSVFCLQPPGDSPTRKGFYDALLLGALHRHCSLDIFGSRIIFLRFSGCIPVRFQRFVKYPFDSTIRYDDFSVYIPESRILEHSMNIVDHLRDIDDEKVLKMQQALNRVGVRLQYSEFGSDVERQAPDAAALAIEEVFRSIYKPQRPQHREL